jgi:hypothetical protein
MAKTMPKLDCTKSEPWYDGWPNVQQAPSTACKQGRNSTSSVEALQHHTAKDANKRAWPAVAIGSAAVCGNVGLHNKKLLLQLRRATSYHWVLPQQQGSCRHQQRQPLLAPTHVMTVEQQKQAHHIWSVPQARSPAMQV